MLCSHTYNIHIRIYTYMLMYTYTELHPSRIRIYGYGHDDDEIICAACNLKAYGFTCIGWLTEPNTHCTRRARTFSTALHWTHLPLLVLFAARSSSSDECAPGRTSRSVYVVQFGNISVRVAKIYILADIDQSAYTYIWFGDKMNVLYTHIYMYI